MVRVAGAATVARAAAESTAVDSGGRALTDQALGLSGRPPTIAPAAAYSYRQRVVYLRQGQPVDAAARVALVHALTLALQDQSADLATLRRQAADDPDRRATNAGAAGRWLGDSYGTFRTGRRLCTYVNIVLADTESREQLLRDLGHFVATRDGRAAVARSADRGVRLRSCG